MRRSVLALAACAALLAAAFAARWPVRGQPTGEPFPSEDGYASLASHVADTGELRDVEGNLSAFREPAYPLVLGACFKLFGKRYAVEVALNALCNALLVLAVYKTAAALFGERVGFLSAAISAFYPPFIYYAARPLRESLLTLLSVAGIWALVDAYRRRKTALFAAAGAVNSIGALTNTTFLPFGACAAPAWLLFLLRREPRRALLWTAVYLAAFVLVYSPWPVRNYLVFHRFVAGTAGAGGTVFYTNQIVPSEVGGLDEERRIVAADPAYQEAAKLDRVEADRFFWKKGMERVKADPARFARLCLKRFFVDQWRIVPRPRPFEQSYVLLKWTAILSNGWIVPLGLIGLLFLGGLRPPEAGWIGLFILSYNSIYAAILSMLRYRQPIMPWIIIFAALALHRAAERVRP